MTSYRNNGNMNYLGQDSHGSAATTGSAGAGAQSINNATWTKVDWDEEEWSSKEVQWNDDELIPAIEGLYLVIATGVWASNSTGYRVISVELDGVGKFSTYYTANTSSVNQSMGLLNITPAYLASNNTAISVKVYQNSGAALNFRKEHVACNLIAMRMGSSK